MLQVRKLRFRRPRPKLIDVDNPDGDLKGSPVELNLAGKDPNNIHRIIETIFHERLVLLCKIFLTTSQVHEVS